MEMLFDVMIDILFEICFEGYVSLCSAFIPERMMNEKLRKIIFIVFIIIAGILLIGLIAGIVLLIESKGTSAVGWAVAVPAVIYFIAGVVLKFVSVFRK